MTQYRPELKAFLGNIAATAEREMRAVLGHGNMGPDPRSKLTQVKMEL
jgi:hypothetical protein